MTGRTRLHGSLAAMLAALWLAGHAPVARATDHDELASESWDGSFNLKFKASGSAAPPPPASPPATGTGSPGTTTPGDDGTTTDGGGGTATEPSMPPEAPGGDPVPAEPGDDDEPKADPAPTGGSGFPPPAPAPLPSCGAHWVVVQKCPEAYSETTSTSLTNRIFRTDAMATICTAYSRSESSLFLDWFSTQMTGSQVTKQYEVELKLEGGCPNCHPRIGIEGTGRAQTVAQLKLVSMVGSVHAGTNGYGSSSTAWAGPVDCGVNSSSAVFGGKSGASSTVSFGDIKIGIGGGGGTSLAQHSEGKLRNAVVTAGSTKVRVINWGASSAVTCGDNENVQANAHAGNALILEGTTSCGAYGRYELNLKTE